MDSARLQEKFPVRLFLTLFGGVALLILGGAWYIGNERIDGELDMLRANEISSVVMGVRRLDDELQAPFHHLRRLAGDEVVRQAIGTGGKDVATMEAAFSVLIGYHGMYDKARWIDETGQERVRVNNVDGKPVAVMPANLQNLADSYYFKNAMNLKAGQVYISPLDLNIERGQVETPAKPVLRLAMPVADGQGSARGLLVLNVAAQQFLDAFTDSLADARDHAMLLNSEGYWLVSPNPEEAWGFMFKRRDTLGSQNPAAWRAITEIPSGQVELADGLWTWSTVYPLKVKDARNETEIPYWLAVSHLPANQLALVRHHAWRTVLTSAAILLAIFAVLTAWLARAVAGRTLAKVEAARAHAEADAAHRINETQKRFRLLVEANANGLLVADSGGHIVLANVALERMFGYDKDELLGQPIEVLLPDTHRHGHADKFSGYMRAPQARPMGAGRELFGRRKDGSILPVEISLSAFTENGQQFVDALVADISERKREERMHQQIENRLQLLLQTNPNGLLVVDEKGLIQMTNPAVERMFGYGAGELIGQAVETLVPEVSRGHHGDLRLKYLQDPIIRTMGPGLDLHGQRKDGGTFPIEVSLASFNEEGRVFVQATVVDRSGMSRE